MSIGSHMDTKEFHNFVNQYSARFPIVTIGFTLPSIANVLIDNTKGFYDLIDHQITHHHQRKLAFIQGAEFNYDAIIRFNVFKEVLKKHNIPLDQKLIIPGDFLRPAGLKAIDILLDKRKLKPEKDFESIIAANDNIAFGAIEALQKRGISIPHDITVVGFDDVEEARAITPPLTTVRQPISEVGKQAVNMLLSIINNVTCSKNIMLPTEVVYRESCGCFSPALNQVIIQPVNFLKGSHKNKPELNRRLIINKIIKATRFPNHRSSIKQIELLFDSFIEELARYSESDINNPDFKKKKNVTLPRSPFLTVLTEILSQIAVENRNISAWQGIISILQQFTHQFYVEQKVLNHAETLLHMARIFIGEFVERLVSSQTFYVEKRLSLINLIGRNLIGVSKIEDLSTILIQQLKRIGIPSCYISLYEGNEYPSKNSKLILFYNESSFSTHPSEYIRFPSHYLFPRTLINQKKPHALVIEPLHFRDNQLGFIVFEVGPIEHMIYETLRDQISASIQSILLFSEREELVKILENRKDELEKMTTVLTRSNTDLEQFAYVASHDLQEPLRTISSFLSLLEKKYHGTFNEEATEFFTFILDAVDRMKNLILDLLQYSRLTIKEKVFQPTDCNQVLNIVLKTLSLTIKETQAEVTSDKLPIAMVDPRQLNQLFQNLIQNALKFKSDRIPQIHIGYREKKSNWEFYVKDNGIGIDPRFHARIFTIFQRLNRIEEFKGTGIGLALCQKIVERHNGKIWVESEYGKGSTFFFTIPIQ